MDTPSPKTWKYLAPDPKSSSTQLCVRGTRVRARTLYGLCGNSEPMTPEEAAEQYNVPVEAVLESIAYCESNPPELLEHYARGERLLKSVDEYGRLRPTPERTPRTNRP